MPRLVLRLLGVELLDLRIEEAEDEEDDTEVRTDHTGTLVGFTRSPGDQRWEPGADLGEDDED